MSTPSLPPSGPDPAGQLPAGSSAAPATAKPKSGLTPIHLVTIAAAITGGATLTLFVMSARPAARDVAAPAAPVPVAVSARAAATTVDVSVPPKWTTASQMRWITNARRNVAFELSAERPVQVWMKQVTPSLVVRCMDKRTDVFVFTDSAARIESEDSDHTVRLTIDNGSAEHQRWPDSVEHDALFAPDGAALARRLMSATTFTFGFSPHNAAPVLVQFDVRGLAGQIQPMAARCGWR